MITGSGHFQLGEQLPDDFSLLDAVPVAILLGDEEGRVTAVNRTWTELSGLAAAESTGDGWLHALEPRERIHLLEFLQLPADTTTADYHVRDGHRSRWTRWRVGRAAGANGPVRVMVVTDISDERAREASLRHRATHDPLTGLVNRSRFLALVDHALRQHDRDDIAVVFVDLEGFKMVNDTGGHLLGDHVLAAVAARLHRAVRPSDVVGRVGGDEFAVLCRDVGPAHNAGAIATRIRAAFAEPLEVDGDVWPVVPTVGLATPAVAGDSAEALLAAADRAMYAGKRVGRGRPPARRRALAEQPGPPAQPELVALADGLIEQLYRVGLNLASCLRTVPPGAAARLNEATAILDSTIGLLRTSVFDNRSGDESDDRLRLAVQLVGPDAGPPDAAGQSIDGIEAAYSLQRALLALDQLAAFD